MIQYYKQDFLFSFKYLLNLKTFQTIWQEKHLKMHRGQVNHVSLPNEVFSSSLVKGCNWLKYKEKLCRHQHKVESLNMTA